MKKTKTYEVPEMTPEQEMRCFLAAQVATGMLGISQPSQGTINNVRTMAVDIAKTALMIADCLIAEAKK